MDIAVFVVVVLARFVVPLAIFLIGLLTFLAALYDRFRALRLDNVWLADTQGAR